MPRLRSGHDHWEIAQDGAKLVIIDGGKQSTRKFVSPTHAKVQHDKLVAEKLAAGWELTDEPAPVTEVGEPREPALEAALAADPYDEQTTRVYGDWYQTRGHPRGELIAVQLSNRRDADDQARKLLVRHKRELLGELARHELPGDDSPFIWRLGFIRGIDVHEGAARELVPDVLAHPSGRFLCEARLYLNDDFEIAHALGELAELVPNRLRVLSIVSYARIEELDDVPSFTDLRSLAVKLYGAPATPEAFAAIAQVAPSLESLHVAAEGDDEAWPELQPLFARGDLRLRELALDCDGFVKAAMVALAEGPLAATLVKLDMSGTNSHLWVRDFVERRARFARLEQLRVRIRGLHAHTVETLRGSIARVVDERVDPDRERLDPPDGDEYDEVQE
jgi:uncharacterized protein (TIGR02996 family)